MILPAPTPPADHHCIRAEQLKLAALATGVGAARRFARDRLRSWRLHELVDDVELIVSELVTNSIVATGTFETPASYVALHDRPLNMVVIRLRVSTTGLYAEVWDSATAPPVPAQADGLDEGGRGLALVEALSADWGYYHPSGAPGKITWARLEITEALPAGLHRYQEMDGRPARSDPRSQTVQPELQESQVFDTPPGRHRKDGWATAASPENFVSP